MSGYSIDLSFRNSLTEMKIADLVQEAGEDLRSQLEDEELSESVAILEYVFGLNANSQLISSFALVAAFDWVGEKFGTLLPNSGFIPTLGELNFEIIPTVDVPYGMLENEYISCLFLKEIGKHAQVLNGIELDEGSDEEIFLEWLNICQNNSTDLLILEG